MNATIRAILDELRESFEQIYGEQLLKLILFGSQAREDAGAESDIDVLVVLARSVRAGEEIARVGETTSGLSLKHGVVISCIFVSEERYKTEQSPLLLNVRREGVTT